MDLRQQKENPKATVAILCPYIFFAQAFKSILEQYPDAEIVPDYGATPASETYIEAEKDQYRAWLKESSLPWRDIELSDLTPNEFFSKYSTIVAPFYNGWASHPALKSHKKVRIFYGGAKDLWIFSLTNAYFDLICTPGPYFTQVLEDLYGKYGVQVLTSGEPKLDRLVTLTKDEARGQLSIETVKPVVLVASTWGKLSSLSKIAPALISMTDEYEVVVKAHHMTTSYDPGALAVFAGTPIRIIDQTTPIATALKAADVVISDGSGAIFDALLSNTPVVIIDTVGNNPSFFVETAFYGTANSKFTGVATSEESLEQVIKKPELRIGPVIQGLTKHLSQNELISAIEKSLKNQKEYAEARKYLTDKYFLPVDGNASLRVAEALSKIARSPSFEEKSPQAKLFLALINDFQIMGDRVAHTVYEKKLAGELKNTEKLAYLKALPRSKRFWAVFNEFFE